MQYDKLPSSEGNREMLLPFLAFFELQKSAKLCLRRTPIGVHITCSEMRSNKY